MATISKILCAVDLSEISPQVAEYATLLATALNSEIHVLYVAPSLTQYVGFHVPPTTIENFVGEIVAGAEDTMEQFIRDNFSGTNVTGVVSSGYASDEILAYAEKQGMDMIVMGTHGRKGIDRVLFGSVAEKIVKSADVPVLTLRPKAA